MSLKYTQLDQIKIDYFSINAVTDAFSKLIENDNQLINTLQKCPGIWECKWYNDDSIAGYQKGAAVWVNTDEVTQFITAKEDEIKSYILNSEYRSEFLQISSDHSKTFQLYQNICTGSNGYKQLYYLGDITKCAQLMVAVSADENGNKNFPIKGQGWEEQFRLSTENMYKDCILDILDIAIDFSLSTHIENYHLSGMTMNQLTAKYLLNDFSNIAIYQSCNTHNIKNRPKTMDGFDKVVKFVHISTDVNTQRWFRLWNSGYLEHGGIVPFGGQVPYQLSIQLDWEYKDNGIDVDVIKTAPVYDYKVQYDEFYAINQKPMVDNTVIDVNPNNIGQQMTYEIHVSPIYSNNSKFTLEQSDVFNIGNNGFQIYGNSGVLRYTYYTAGFITSPSLRRYMS